MSNPKSVEIPEVVEAWDAVKKVKVSKAEVKSFEEIKGVQIWAPPFTSPSKAPKAKFEAPKNQVFIVHVIKWAKKYLVKLNEERDEITHIGEISSK
jgi:hypothetical protein